MSIAEHYTPRGVSTATAVAPDCGILWQPPEHAVRTEEDWNWVKWCDEVFERHEDSEPKERFEEFYNQYHTLAYNFMCHVLGQEGEIPDSHTVDAFIVASLGYAKKSPEESPGIWLLRLCVAEAGSVINFRRPVKTKLGYAAQEIVDRIPFLGRSPKTRPAPGDTFEILKALHPRDRVLITLKDVVGLTYPEIEQVLRLDQDQVRWEMAKAREAARRL
jgi:DNA-directed RNA polymerase specialized sigma24 family protein